jgi:hypothetical protein
MIDLIYAKVIIQTAAERDHIACFHEPVLVDHSSDDLLDR